MSMKNPVTLAGIEPATFRFVAQHFNHCATATGIRGSQFKLASGNLNYQFHHKGLPFFFVISGFLLPQHGASSGCGWKNCLHIYSIVANILNKQS